MHDTIPVIYRTIASSDNHILSLYYSVQSDIPGCVFTTVCSQVHIYIHIYIYIYIYIYTLHFIAKLSVLYIHMYQSSFKSQLQGYAFTINCSL